MPCVEVLTDFCRMAKPASAAADSLRPAAMVILRCSSLRASFWAFIAFAHFSMSCKEQNHSGTHKLVLTTLISFTWNTVVTFRHKPFIIFTPSYVLRIFVSFICPKNTSSETQIMISTFPNDLLLKARLDHPPPSPLHQYTHKSNLPLHQHTQIYLVGHTDCHWTQPSLHEHNHSHTDAKALAANLCNLLGHFGFLLLLLLLLLCLVSLRLCCRLGLCAWRTFCSLSGCW